MTRLSLMTIFILDIIDKEDGEDNQNQVPVKNEPPLIDNVSSEEEVEEPTTKEPESVDGCKLPYYPANDPDQRSENAWRFGTEHGSRFEYSSLGGTYKDDYDFQIDIKTLATDAIIFYGSDIANNNTDIIALFLKDGYVHHSFDCSSGPSMIISDRKVSDQQWHTIYFRRNATEGYLTVDDGPTVTGYSQGTTQGISVSPPFFVGGVNPSFDNNAIERIVSFIQGEKAL